MRPAYLNKDTGASDGSDRARAAGIAAFPIRARAARNHRAPRRWGSCAATLCFERSNKGLWCKRFEVEPSRRREVALDHAARTAFQILGAVLPLAPSLPSLN